MPVDNEHGVVCEETVGARAEKHSHTMWPICSTPEMTLLATSGRLHILFEGGDKIVFCTDL